MNDYASHTVAGVWFYFKQNKGAVIGLTFILAVALISILPLDCTFDPIEQNRSALLLPPAWYEGGNSAYLLGTDDIGRDILSRIIYGTRISVFAGFIIVILVLHFRNEPRFACRLLWWRIGYINCSFY